MFKVWITGTPVPEIWARNPLIFFSFFKVNKLILISHVIYGMGQEVLFWKIEKSQ